jgi:multimeric flavodoxin WrbA
MDVIIINGSPRKNGNTAIALEWMADELRQEGITTETIQIGDQIIRGCIACEHCATSQDNLCLFDNDGINDLIRKLRQADGFVIGSPTYFYGMAGTLKCAMDRLFYAGRRNGGYRNKVGAAAVSVRRNGGSETFNQIITYYHAAEMIVAPSRGVGYGRKKGEISQDTEGQQGIRHHANAMAWLLKMKEATEGSVRLPRAENRRTMNFIR